MKHTYKIVLEFKFESEDPALPELLMFDGTQKQVDDKMAKLTFEPPDPDNMQHVKFTLARIS